MGGVLVPFWKLRSAIAYRHAAPLGRRCRCSLQPLPDAALSPPACFPPSPLVLLSRSCCRSCPPLPQPPLTTCRSLGDLHGFSQCFRLLSSHRWPSVWLLASPGTSLFRRASAIYEATPVHQTALFPGRSDRPVTVFSMRSVRLYSAPARYCSSLIGGDYLLIGFKYLRTVFLQNWRYTRRLDGWATHGRASVEIRKRLY